MKVQLQRGKSLRLLAVATAITVCLAGAPSAAADPSAPPAPPSPGIGPFPPDQNQLPSLPREPEIYDKLPIPVPDKDPWYRDPVDIASYRPGQIVRTREVQTRVLGIPFPVYTKQLLYRSEDVHGRPIVTATSVIVPGIPWHGSPRPVVSYQEAIDSTDSSCNPSYTLQTGTMKEAALAVYWLAQGFAINVPDFDGKFNTFNTYAEGKMVLDGLRAMKNDKTLGLKDSGIALYGYSGGGSGSMRAAELRKTYAPDVKILGAAFGGAPANLVKQAEYATVKQPGVTGTSSFTMWLGFVGLSREYPDVFDAKKMLTPAGQRIIADIQKRCVYTHALTGIWRPISEYYQPGKSLAETPAVQKVLRDNSLGHHVPDIPLLWFHAPWDELIPPREVVIPTAKALYEKGADMRFFTFPAPEHLTVSAAGWMPAMIWISAVLRGMSPGPRFFLPWQPLPEGFPGS
ncbi:lipase family protein [Tsukamurella sp. 1534]|uniref:lipase family protein n=1 Tax=Tsukamurella sp. 1534 TaxID=1151061 RepID=UPI0002DED331|nr:lipase family protein [Tsukamurella sp. 1534]